MLTKWKAAVLMVLLCAILGCAPPESSGQSNKAAPPSDAEAKLLQYVLSQQLGEDGVYTNRLDTDQTAELASGHEVLSESAGLLMRYYAKSGDREAFEHAWHLARRVFNQKSGFSYRYSPKLNKRYSVNAAVDDLRLIRALYEAADVFGEKAYRAEADKFGGRLLMHNVKDHRLYDFYDEHYGMTNDFITLCYVDHFTLRQVKEANKELRDGMLDLVQRGYLSDEFPLYESRYRYGTGQYESDGGIQTVESLLTVLSLAEIGQQKPASVAYVKARVEEDTLFGRYTRRGEPLTDVRSTALYALAALIGHEVGDGELYTASIRRMEAFQIQDPGSRLYGGFGDPATGQAYSFDNLMALLAYAANR
ncbi:hypothetical protein [Paenibacillus sp. PL2-23]|uniref:hypothetical protein n=1 Tax=Paenibacillus sp. PL2-23 TaxID=2100729 RepID=UPI0030FCC434